MSAMLHNAHYGMLFCKTKISETLIKILEPTNLYLAHTHTHTHTHILSLSLTLSTSKFFFNKPRVRSLFIFIKPSPNLRLVACVFANFACVFFFFCSTLSWSIQCLRTINSQRIQLVRSFNLLCAALKRAFFGRLFLPFL